ncbi:MAG: DUF488 family protein [Gemmobacter sp.]|jgi:uncharacterized protein YeaO (DUF488 family)|nr:DUF488 family protein [Gemmobacter sp.]
MSLPILIARVYDPPGTWIGACLLVDRLWPRGVTKAELPLEGWPRDLTPSTALRKWFHADPSQWEEFRQRYLDELAARPEAMADCLALCRRGPVTLLTAARDRERNHAIVLRDHLLALLAGE